jgi:hypothetical protein
MKTCSQLQQEVLIDSGWLALTGTVHSWSERDLTTRSAGALRACATSWTR